MAEYCARADVFARLTTYGYRYAVDRDTLDGVASTSEEARYVDSAISYAGSLLDELVAMYAEPETVRAQALTWMRDRAIDLAVWRCVTHGGRDVPESIQQSYDNAIEALDRVRSGKSKIPGMIYSRPNEATGGPRWPRAANVS